MLEAECEPRREQQSHGQVNQHWRLRGLEPEPSVRQRNTMMVQLATRHAADENERIIAVLVSSQLPLRTSMTYNNPSHHIVKLVTDLAREHSYPLEN